MNKVILSPADTLRFIGSLEETKEKLDDEVYRIIHQMIRQLPPVYLAIIVMVTYYNHGRRDFQVAALHTLEEQDLLLRCLVFMVLGKNRIEETVSNQEEMIDLLVAKLTRRTLRAHGIRLRKGDDPRVALEEKIREDHTFLMRIAIQSGCGQVEGYTDGCGDHVAWSTYAMSAAEYLERRGCKDKLRHFMAREAERPSPGTDPNMAIEFIDDEKTLECLEKRLERRGLKGRAQHARREKNCLKSQKKN